MLIGDELAGVLTWKALVNRFLTVVQFVDKSYKAAYERSESSYTPERASGPA